MSVQGFCRVLPVLCLLTACAGQPSIAPSAPEKKGKRPAAVQVDDGKPLSEAQVIAAVDDEKSIFFASGQTMVDDPGKQKLQLHAARLKENPKLQVRLVGYTDDRGSSSYNLLIAEQRVDAVFRLLRSYGVPARQLQRYALGGEKNSNTCTSPACLAKMRRVELIDKE